jgi:hypothetical protein
VKPETYNLVSGLLNHHILHVGKQIRECRANDAAARAELEQEFNQAIRARDEFESEYLRK